MGLKPMNCPGPLRVLRDGQALLPRAADPLRRARPAAPQRAERHAARPAARPPLHPGRRAHLLHATSRSSRRCSPASSSASPGTTCSASTCASSSRRGPSSGSAPTRSGTAPRPRSRRRWSSGGYEYDAQRGRRRVLRPEDRPPHARLARTARGSSAPCSSTTTFPERFDLTYTGADNAEHQPAMIHRALVGSFERFIGILLEHTGGELPLWLAPVAGRRCCRSPTATTTTPARSPRRCAPPACARRSTTAPSRSGARSARPSCRRCPTCSWSATARPRSAPSRCAATARATWARSRSTRPSRGSRAKSA